MTMYCGCKKCGGEAEKCLVDLFPESKVMPLAYYKNKPTPQSDQEKIKHLEAENERLRTGINTTVSALWSWCYSYKSKRITDIYEELKSLVDKNG